MPGTHPTIEDGLASLPQTRLPDGSILSFRVEGLGPVLARWSEDAAGWEVFKGAAAPAPAAPAAAGLNPDLNLADLADAALARKALGLSQAATAGIGDKQGQVAAGDHGHHEYAHLFGAISEQFALHLERLDRLEDGALSKASNLEDLADVAAACVVLGLKAAAFAEIGDQADQVAAGDHSHTGWLAVDRNLTDLPEPAAARKALGLGAAAVASIGDKRGQVAAGDHEHVIPPPAGYAELQANVASVAERISAVASAMLTRGGNLRDIEDKAAARKALGLGELATASFGTDAESAARGDHQHSGTMAADRNLADLTNVPAARKALGLGGAAVADVGSRRGQVAAGDHSHSAALLDVTHFGWDSAPNDALGATLAAVASTGALGVGIPAGEHTVPLLAVPAGRVEGAGSATVLAHEQAGAVFEVTGPARVAHLTVSGSVVVASAGVTLEGVTVDQVVVRAGCDATLIDVRFTGHSRAVIAEDGARAVRLIGCAMAGGYEAGVGVVTMAACSGDLRNYAAAPIETGDSE